MSDPLRPRSRVLWPLAALAWLAAGGTAPAQVPPADASARPKAPLAAGRKYPPRLYETQRLVGEPPTIDGRLDDTAWREGD